MLAELTMGELLRHGYPIGLRDEWKQPNPQGGFNLNNNIISNNKNNIVNSNNNKNNINNNINSNAPFFVPKIYTSVQLTIKHVKKSTSGPKGLEKWNNHSFTRSHAFSQFNILCGNPRFIFALYSTSHQFL